MAPSWPFRSLQLFAAAALALLVAVALGLGNPFWAAMPVWVVAQNVREDLLLRAALRFGGTCAGALLGIAALSVLPGPGPQILFLAAAIGIGTGLAYWIGTLYSYGVMLAAITVGVVLVPALDHPVDAVALATDRVLCTLIGVVCVTAITFAFTPGRGAPPPRREPPPPGAVLRHGLTAGAGALAGGIAVAAIGGPVGIGIALPLCIFGVVIGSSRMGHAIAKVLPLSAAIGVAAALAYRALVLGGGLPDGAMLAVAIAFLAAGAILRGHPRTAALGLDANMCFLLVSEAGTAGHGFASHLQGGTALALSGFAIAAGFRAWAQRG